MLAAAVTCGQAVLLIVWMRKATDLALGFWAAVAAAGLGAFISLVISAELVVHSSALVLETVGRLFGFPLLAHDAGGDNRPGQPLDSPSNGDSARDGLEHRVGDIEVGVDVLDVVLILEGVDQAQQLSSRILVQRHGICGNQR